MKYILLLLLLQTTGALAQKPKIQYYLYDKDWNGAKDLASADYVLQSTIIGDSAFVNRIFKAKGRLWRQESYRDEERTMPNGQFAWYDNEGRIDSSGYVSNKKKDGSWAYYDDTLGIYLLINYENGKEVLRRDYVNKLIKTLSGQKTFEEEEKERDTAKTGDSTFTLIEKEAAFNGGLKGYKKYLEKNLKPPTDIVKTGSVKLQFLINKDGYIQDLFILKSLQMTADIEALRVLGAMPRWTPASQNGKNVIYQAIQLITFLQQ